MKECKPLKNILIKYNFINPNTKDIAIELSKIFSSTMTKESLAKSQKAIHFAKL